MLLLTLAGGTSTSGATCRRRGSTTTTAAPSCAPRPVRGLDMLYYSCNKASRGLESVGIAQNIQPARKCTLTL